MYGKGDYLRDPQTNGETCNIHIKEVHFRQLALYKTEYAL